LHDRRDDRRVTTADAACGCEDGVAFAVGVRARLRGDDDVPPLIVALPVTSMRSLSVGLTSTE